MAERRKVRTTSDRPQPAVDDADRESMLRWLQWNDPNGCYTDDVAIHERRACLTHAEAKALYEEAVGHLDEQDFEPRKGDELSFEERRAKNAAEAQRKVADALNQMSLDPKLFAESYMSEHRTGQQTFAKMAWAFFKALAAHETFDLRNEDARELARFLVNAVETRNRHEVEQGRGEIGHMRFI